MRATVIASLLLATVLSGCGLHDPYTGTQPAKTSPGRPTTPRIVNNEVQPDSPPPPTRQYTAGAATPERALEQFASTYINWSYKTLAANRHRLARQSVGSARAAELRAAVETGRDSMISQAKVTNRGRVLSIGRHRDRRSTWIVVTQETTTGSASYAGLPPALHVTFAQVRTVAPNSYAVSSWQPRS